MDNLLEGRTLYFVMISYMKLEQGGGEEWEYEHPEEEVLSSAFTLEEAQCLQQYYSQLYPGGHEYIYIDQVVLGKPRMGPPLVITNRYSFDIKTRELKESIEGVATHTRALDSIRQYENEFSLFAGTEEEAWMKFNRLLAK